MSGLVLIDIRTLLPRVASGHEHATSRLVHEAQTSGRVAVTYCEMEPGGRAAKHKHDGAAQLFLVTAGELALHGDDDQLRVGTEQAALVHAGVAHAVENRGDAVARYLAVTLILAD